MHGNMRCFDLALVFRLVLSTVFEKDFPLQSLFRMALSPESEALLTTGQTARDGV